ncbi:hypothetical protein [Streptomyces tirandamycinicus]|uniref:Uncharacterized protein n=1 Tax=Streptomyces tirandamycinicus TaxID=2174846 RepID=A0A2S1T232_9ACTN|nr:hypothetical protein [Streptomyces tirandamycinicus]AWI32725.1 hypothetical protein DDW44_30905 [Streptomyces tirandamycinicus]
MVFRLSAKEAARYPGLRARLDAQRTPQKQPAKARTAAAGGSSAYVEWEPAEEIGDARHWMLDLPDMELINANEVRRWHWGKERRVAASIREATAVLARSLKVPRLTLARVVYVVHPKARTRVFDPSNWALSAKAAVDGLQDAGVFEDDNASVVTGVDPRAGQRQHGAQIRMSLVIIDQGRGEEQ